MLMTLIPLSVWQRDDTVKPRIQEPGFFNLALTGSYINRT